MAIWKLSSTTMLAWKFDKLDTRECRWVIKEQYDAGNTV